MRIAFFSTMGGLPWGGSEELWSRAARVLLADGHEVAFNSQKWPSTPAPLRQLMENGAVGHFRPKRRLGRSLRRTLEKLRLTKMKHYGWLHRTRPELVLISFSYHGDDPQIAHACRALGIPYAILLQAAGPHHWILPSDLDQFRAAYAHAERCFFVSDENRETLESNLAVDLSAKSDVVDNPFNVRPDANPAWPSADPTWRLACVARIHFLSKSQDLLVRVLRQPKWRARPLCVTLWGSDDGCLLQLRDLIDLHGLNRQLEYGGFATDMEALWADHHALLLPSRMEGNSLSLVEAMLCGRVPITTNVGRAAELIDDNETGFLAPAATVELVDETLERAWQCRDQWQQMGQRSAAAIRQRHSLRPAEAFADRILDLAGLAQRHRQKAAA
jgi:glycosyltransferase involved in cell wall biosynthesis